jgi:NTE family protein
MIYNEIMEQRTLALALGGGGVRGLAHIGVVKVLIEAGIRIDFLAGTSIGGIVAIALASGKSIEEMEAEAIRLTHVRELMKLIDLTGHQRGLLHGEKVRKYLAGWLGEDLPFENLKIPTVLNAVDLVTGKEITISKGPVMPALFGTICVPGVFSPVFLDGNWLVDGGVLNNLPIIPARFFNPDVVIGVDVQLNPAQAPHWKSSSNKPHLPWPVPTPEFFLDFYRSMLIMISAQTQRQLEVNPPDLLISPPIDKDITMFTGFSKAVETIAAGEQAALALLPKIEMLVRK